MITLTNLNIKSDLIGSTASLLCLAHCLATPFLFAAHTGHVHGHQSNPVWWGILDLLFIGISLIAVYWSAKNTSKRWMQYALWLSWGFLSFVILNEKVMLIPLAEAVIYFPSIALMVLHLYNRKYCKCQTKNCCNYYQ